MDADAREGADADADADAGEVVVAPVGEGFEAGMPAGWTVVSPNCSGSGALSVVEGEAHSGTHALAVTGGGGYCDHVFLQTALTTEGPAYARFWVRLESALGDGHVTFLTMHDRLTNKDLRMGGQSKILMWNRETDDATLPVLSPAGIAQSVAIAPATWTCIELRVDGAAGTIDTWVDGAAVVALTVDASATPEVDARWLDNPYRPALTTFALGWESYAGQAMNLRFDDVALDTQPIGCR